MIHLVDLFKRCSMPVPTIIKEMPMNRITVIDSEKITTEANTTRQLAMANCTGITTAARPFWKAACNKAMPAMFAAIIEGSMGFIKNAIESRLLPVSERWAVNSSVNAAPVPNASPTATDRATSTRC